MHSSDILNLGWKGALVVCLLATVNSPGAKENVPKRHLCHFLCLSDYGNHGSRKLEFSQDSHAGRR